MGEIRENLIYDPIRPSIEVFLDDKIQKDRESILSYMYDMYDNN